jgi:hypothetical protein
VEAAAEFLTECNGTAGFAPSEAEVSAINRKRAGDRVRRAGRWGGASCCRSKHSNQRLTELECDGIGAGGELILRKRFGLSRFAGVWDIESRTKPGEIIPHLGHCSPTFSLK